MGYRICFYKKYFQCNHIGLSKGNTHAFLMKNTPGAGGPVYPLPKVQICNDLSFLKCAQNKFKLAEVTTGEKSHLTNRVTGKFACRTICG